MSNCVFCRIVAKEIPAAVVYEDEHTLAFMDAGQVNPGHVLVAAKEHAENLYELNDAQAGGLLRTAARRAGRARDPRRLPAARPLGLSGEREGGVAERAALSHASSAAS